jgi:tRNA A37 threonylcarbamoyladenosine biosynthesis protein TsaE
MYREWATRVGASWGNAGMSWSNNKGKALQGLRGKVVAVEGNIAAGKTTLINGIAR